MNGILKQAQAEKSQERKLLWDEENRLEAIDENGFVSNYWYDAAGERTVKTSGESEQMFVNGLFSGGNTSTANFTAYINPYIVVSKGGHYTKHIYIGSQRIVSKLGDLDSYGADPRRIEYAGNNVDGALINYKNKYEASQQTIKDRYAIFEVPYLGIDNDDYVNGQGFCCDDTQQGNATKSAMQNDNPELFQYYYHSDHLGSTSLITNLDGEVVQHVEYVPFGEVFIEERNNTWNTPYLFNAKELDEETGLYCYGARYYDPRVSLWLSADPMQEKYPNVSTYAYCVQNPVNVIDPDGRIPLLLIPLIKGAAGAIADAAAQVTVSMVNGKDFGEAMSSIDYTSVGTSFVTSALAMPGMSTAAKVATVAVVAADAAIDVNAKGEIQTVGGVIGENKPITNAAIDAVSSVVPGKVVDNVTSGFNKAVNSDLSSSAAATLTKETKSSMRKAQAAVNSTAFQIGADAIADYTGGLISGQVNETIGTGSTTSILAPLKDPLVQPNDATRVQQPIFPVYPK